MLGCGNVYRSLLAVLSSLAVLTATHGACVYEGVHYPNATFWKPEVCSLCRCEDDVAICETIGCRNTHCDTDNGGVLKVVPGRCCPECVVETARSCEHEGEVLGHDTAWRPTACTACSCWDGSVTCRQESCPTLACLPGEVQHQTERDCCPRCIRPGRSCNYGDNRYHDGDTWQPVPCTHCTCDDGQTRCYIADCAPVVCAQDEEAVVRPGQCCPECAGRSCTAQNRQYRHGEQWKPDPCMHCVCRHGDPHCVRTSCPENPACPPDSLSIVREGRCCPDCVPRQAPCERAGVTRYSGDMWNETGCEFCVCEAGAVSCFTAECAQLNCQGDEQVVSPGKCCPECSSPAAECQVQNRVYRDGESWEPDLCRRCSCKQGLAQCYHETCAPCPPGTRTAHVPGECCGECQPVSCSDPCASCDDQNPSVCRSCQDSSALLQDGRCVQACSTAHYRAGERVCGRCHPSCSSCGGPTQHHCRECPQGLQLKHGQCVADCGDRFYSQGSQCSACHPSCSRCSGPGADSCAACQVPSQACHPSCSRCSGPGADSCAACQVPSQVLRDGRCADRCGEKQYVRDGRCHDCDGGCLTCLPDAPVCTSCPRNHALHEGRCTRTCPQGFYQNQQNCRACHPSCLRCRGPRPNQCVACGSDKVLFNEQCLVQCPTGFIAQQGSCEACHISCRSCRGPQDSDCLSCAAPSEVILRSRAARGQQHGRCVAQCPPGHFLDQGGICQECYRGCQTCVGRGPGNCTACEFQLKLRGGLCAPQCRDDQYEDSAGVCHDCHPTCSRCSGPADADCSSCRPSLVEQLGRCRMPCPDAHYLNTNGFCQACHPTCDACMAAPGGIESTCLRCRDPATVAAGDRCVRDCGLGFAAVRGSCKACHASCITCASEGLLGCTACAPGYVLAHTGMCTDRCFPGFYPDTGVCKGCVLICVLMCVLMCVLTCVLVFQRAPPAAWSMCVDVCTDVCTCVSACPPGCLECALDAGVLQCTRCRDPYMVVQFGECSQACADQFYIDPVTRVCTGETVTMVTRVCTGCAQVRLLPWLPGCAQVRLLPWLPGCAQVRLLPWLPGCAQVRLLPWLPGCAQVRLLPWLPGCAQVRLTMVTRVCTECDWSCNSCVGPTKADCVQCMGHMTLQNGTCVEECTMGYFPAGQECARCPDRCLTCSSGDTCMECAPPHLLKHDRCVQDCGWGYYADFSSHRCIDCPASCLECADPARCLTCRAGTYLQGALCVPDCGVGFYQDEEEFRCEANRQPPVLLVNGSLVCEIGAALVLSPSFLGASDPDTDPAKLTFHVAGPPTNGRLLVARDGLDRELDTGGTFSYAELTAGLVRFQHLRSQQMRGSVSLQVSDRQLVSVPVRVDIRAVSQAAPRLVRNRPLVVEEGGAGEITTATNLDIQDEDNPEDVVITRVQGPAHGRLASRNEQQLDTFTLAELHAGSIRYVHDGSETQSDVVLLQVSDGFNLVNILFNIQIRPQDNAGPLLLANTVAHVQEGQMVQISSNMLLATDVDTPDNQLVYRLTPPAGNPQQGELLLVLPVLADGPPTGWQSSEGGRMETKVSQFRQSDIDQGHLWYRHSGSETTRDFFKFQVTDSAEPPNVLEDQEFNIQILPSDDEPPRVAPGVAMPLGITAIADQITTITAAHLAYIDLDSDARDLQYQVTKTFPTEFGMLEHADRPYVPLQSFTQAELEAGKVIYRPAPATYGPGSSSLMFQGARPAHRDKSFQFAFTVSDGVNTLPAQPFVIRVVSDGNAPPRFSSPNSIIKVTQGGTVPVGMEQLAVSDSDTPLSDLRFTLKQAPMMGKVIQKDRNRQEVLREGYIFSLQDIDRNMFHYVHDGFKGGSDQFQVSVSDGSSVVTATISVSVMQVAQTGPVKAPAATLTLSVPELGSSTLSRDSLFYSTDSSAPISYRLESELQQGRLERRRADGGYQALGRGATFTQEEVNSFSIRYTSLGEVGDQPVSDVVFFSVEDTEGHRLPNQVLSITVSPGNNQPPVVSVGKGLEVFEGGRALLTAQDIVATDADTPKSELIVRIDTPPSFGYLENTKQPEGSQTTLAGIPIVQFSVQDLLDGAVHYVQNLHRNLEPVWDGFLFHVTDGTNQSPTYRFNISIQLTNDEQPVMLMEKVVCPEGHGAMVTNVSLYAHDMDTPDQELTFRVRRLPEHGNLRKRQFADQAMQEGAILPVGSSFSYQDVLDELICYIHDGSETQSDEFAVTLTDGQFTEEGKIKVTVGLLNDEAPRVTINRGLQLPAGTSVVITRSILRGTDVDSDQHKLTFILTSDPTLGELQLRRNGQFRGVSVGGAISEFSQDDINNGDVRYQHIPGEPSGSTAFKFDLIDTEGNKMIDQTFLITVTEDYLPPSVVANKGLVLNEGASKKITTNLLSATDADSEPADLVFTVTAEPRRGHLEHAAVPGAPVTTFTQKDLAAHNILYIHTSEEEEHMDSFTFTVSDGKNQVSQTFYITILPVDDAVPMVTNLGLRVQEGVRKTITEFELKAEDADTKEQQVMFTITRPPYHGKVEMTSNEVTFRRVSKFSMTDVYENRISYDHDGSNTQDDSFEFAVSDGTNPDFTVELDGRVVTTTAPQTFQIEILPVDDGTPRIVTNLGLQFLEYVDGTAMNIITKRDLKTTDPDTTDRQLVYTITSPPKHGRLETVAQPGTPVSTFTQEEVNVGIVRYVLDAGVTGKTSDRFMFDVADSKPNVVRGNVFRIRWSLLSFEHAAYNVSETGGTVSVTVKRTGNLNQYAIVLCRTEPGTATSSDKSGAKPGQLDFVQYAGQVQFDEREDTKYCTIVINDDGVYEGVESFGVELSMPAYALLGKTVRATVNINDTEDEPTVEFVQKMYRVNESAGYLFAPIKRTGDPSGTVSAVCYTTARSAQGSSINRLESGSDFRTRGMTDQFRVIFPPGVTTSTCDVKLVDDSEYEEEEEFEIALADTSLMARLGDTSKAMVMIDGPNDVSHVFLSEGTFAFAEDAGTVDVEVVRQGTDLSHSSRVWCATRLSDPASARPGEDYVPSSAQITFGPGQTSQTCSLTILDDVQNPKIEGNETFVVFLSSAVGAELAEPFQAVVTINDTIVDVPSMQFSGSEFSVEESEGVVHVPITRTGDTSYESSVRCYTRQGSAQVMMDFDERRNTDDFRVVFAPGEKEKNCTVFIAEDEVFEPTEEFVVRLGHAAGNHWCGAKVGRPNRAAITITNNEDAPTVQFEASEYKVREPTQPDSTATVMVKVVRTGDCNDTAVVRCSTRDGSATSGDDYSPKSRILKFKPGVRSLEFPVDVLYNDKPEWHESFSVILGPDEPTNAVLGKVAMATVTIMDREASGSLVLPSSPILVSLMDYDDIEIAQEKEKDPSPGYPLVCVTPCDPRYPKYTVTSELCQQAGINESIITYSWEVAMPTDAMGTRQPFETVTDTTVYTRTDGKVLDSLYFSRRFHVRCVAQPVDGYGHRGVALRSNIVTIGTENICSTPVKAGVSRGFQAQSFIANLEYIEPGKPKHPNRLHINIQVPHQDGMVPLVSTFPLHNLQFLLSKSVYRQQHVCSNLITPRERNGLTQTGFLDSVQDDDILAGYHGYAHQFDEDLRGKEAVELYKHLDLKSCIWNFDAYYHMTELIDICGGSVVTDFQVRDEAKSYLTLTVPLYVSYIYVTAPTGWGALEHHTEMDFSFFYNTMLWRTGLETEGALNGHLQVTRILIGDDGRLIIDFKTQTKFRGQYVVSHPTLPGFESRVIAPLAVNTEFELELLWSQQTFDSPRQIWRARSAYNLKDYSGEYVVELVPCTVKPTQAYVFPGDSTLMCTAHQTERFTVPIAFQQTNRPVPVVYTLNTEFHLLNNEKVFLTDPTNSNLLPQELDYKGAFSRGQTIFGRVLWNPEQDLSSAYRLQIEKVYLCTGTDGYIPFFDPDGTIYNEGPQYGCIQPSRHLKYRFLLLDRSNRAREDRYFNQVPFEAHFSQDLSDYTPMSDLAGVDGFMMKVDPLYKVEAGHQWYLQVIYIIGPQGMMPRFRRSVAMAIDKRDVSDNHVETSAGDRDVKNGTNMRFLQLESDSGGLTGSAGAVAASVTILLLLLIIVIIVFVVFRRRRREGRKDKQEKTFDNLRMDIMKKSGGKGEPCGKQDVTPASSVKVKRVNLEVKVNNKSVSKGTEV
ncbi:extracellular matrix organizing protein FRAS1-like [Branchiostoma lanceolatum]|uniref:extracellular matrix organizing protein FRAS1-like n=1 Tax=Branchiostoma lanceolatum TaxID=7740 RepID=UPI003451C978